MSTDKSVLIFGRNICFLRRKYHLPQKAMAKLLGISLYNLRLLEDGKIPKQLTIDFLAPLYDHFHYPLDKLFCTDLEKEKR